jgi:predicted ABC-type transport system involved in lysophospholipase L1 biosynthesis ATPase subunit
MNEADRPSEGPLLELIGIAKSFPAVDGVAPPPVLHGVSLRVSAGESVAVVGPSGSGKSTLLNVIGALARPTSGRVNIDGRDLYDRDDAGLAEFRNRCIGFIFQSHHLLPQCTALENVLVPTLVHEHDEIRTTAPDRARALLHRVGLGDRLAHRPAQLSGGECQRVAVVRALINQPRLVLADEPTGSLDQDSADELGRLLGELNREHGVALIAVTHSPKLAALMQRRLTLMRGSLQPWTPPESRHE